MANETFDPDRTAASAIKRDGAPRDDSFLPELEAMGLDELQDFASERHIDLTGVSSEPGIRDRIRKARPVDEPAAEATDGEAEPQAESKPSGRSRSH